MRLTCPNCGAQYEVPADAIPLAGRDVQCSACQHTWFEKGGPPEPLTDEELFDSVPRPENDEEEDDDLAEVAVAPPPPPRPTRPTVTPEVAGILRSEARREAQARAQEAAAPRPVVAITDRPTARPEPEPGRPAPEPEAEPVRPASRLRELEPLEPPTPLPEPPRRSGRTGARRSERSLDIDQINSTLRATSDRIGGKGPQIGEATRPRRGFSRGFTGALLAAAVLALLYVFAPRIVASLPELATVLDPYVEAVDTARLWLDQRIAEFTNPAEAPAG